MTSVSAAEIDSEAAELGNELHDIQNRFQREQQKAASLSAVPAVDLTVQNSHFFSSQNYGVWLMWALLVFFAILLFTIRRRLLRIRSSVPAAIKTPQLDSEKSLVHPVKIVRIKVRKLTRKT